MTQAGGNAGRAPEGRAPLGAEMRAAAAALAAVAAGRRLPDALSHSRAGLPPASRPAVQDMAYGAVRRLGLLRALADQLNARKPAAALAALQWVALDQLLVPRRSEATIVDQAVEAARADPANAPAAGFLNATLRRFLRERDALLARARSKPVARWNHPDWWVERLRRDHPEHWQQILAANDLPAPLTLRVNRRRTSPEAYLARLAQAGLGARRVGPDALALDAAVPVERLPGFADGEVSVQDAGAQMAALLLGARDGERILDACAAPGGKTCHILQRADARVLALDVDPSRCARILENLEREGLQAEVRNADVFAPQAWWDGLPFDRILVDAPCSASGIVRRQPDVRWLRRSQDLASLASMQRRMLDVLWPLLAPGGTLLYVTCSVFPEEGEAVVAGFCKAVADCERQPLTWVFEEGGPREAVSQLLPSAGAGREHDGFFYARLVKCV